MNMEAYSESYVDVKSICPNWITDNFLDFMDLKLENLKGKKITSIGWWFGIFEMDAAKAWANVTIVDPMFADQDWIDCKLKENIEWMWSKIRWKFEDRIERMKKEIVEIISKSKDDAKILEAKWTLQWYNDCQSSMREYIRRRKILMEHLKNWEENQGKYWLILNPSSWDNIEWVDTNSQDFVIIWHTLWHIYSKSLLDIGDFLHEAQRLLKPGWKLYIIDYVWDISSLERLLEKTKLKKYYKVNKWSFVCCFDKEWLSEFLEKEFK